MNAVAQVEPIEQRAVAQVSTPMHMLQLAIEQNADMDKLQKLMDLQERWEANEARKAFVAAMAAFKAHPPEILKTKHVSYTKKDGSVTKYDHAELGSISAAIAKGLAEHEISHRWDVQQADSRIKVTCVLTHAKGHSESVSLVSAPDESGGKNSIQAIASAVTYLQRYTLLAAAGLAAADMDDDGEGATAEFVTEEQAMNIESLMTEVGADKKKFLAYVNAPEVRKILAKNYKPAMAALESKRSK